MAKVHLNLDLKESEVNYQYEYDSSGTQSPSVISDQSFPIVEDEVPAIISEDKNQECSSEAGCTTNTDSSGSTKDGEDETEKQIRELQAALLEHHTYEVNPLLQDLRKMKTLGKAKARVQFQDEIVEEKVYVPFLRTCCLQRLDARERSSGHSSRSTESSQSQRRGPSRTTANIHSINMFKNIIPLEKGKIKAPPSYERFSYAIMPLSSILKNLHLDMA